MQVNDLAFSIDGDDIRHEQARVLPVEEDDARLPNVPPGETALLCTRFVHGGRQSRVLPGETQECVETEALVDVVHPVEVHHVDPDTHFGGRPLWIRTLGRIVVDHIEVALEVREDHQLRCGIGINVGQAGGGGLELFFNDRPMTLARWPNEGFVKITGLVGGRPVNVRGTKGDRIGKFMYAGERPKRWADEKDVWVHGYWFWDWSDQRHKVESIDTAKRIIAVKPPYHGYGYRVGQWFYAFNILAELDRPGEWYLDREAGTLYFWPPSDLAKGRAVVSVAGELVTMRGTSHVTLRGLTFEAARGTAVAMAGARQSPRVIVPKRSNRAAQPLTVPGTVTGSGPRKGIASRPCRCASSRPKAAGARPLPLRAVTSPVSVS